ncbi:MAG: DNA topoisomerase (ATP-hydrolyzing) subunit B [Candidatus Ryanbacteria bacterium]|nr:DNA topoisomerase (ATP-hydrolyzing) subunit B [Candidatus Ryanbacteria bacterium]
MAKNKPEKKTESNGDYGAKDIFVLEGLEPVRKRPGMYIGSTGVDGLHHLIWEVVDNSIDEAMAGFAKNISVVLLPKNQVRVVDDGRGIPVDIHKQTKKSALETVLTTLHAGGKFGGDAYKVAGGLHGVGVSVVNALSIWLKAEVCKDGFLYTQEYERGKPKYNVKKVGKCDGSGTAITFEPDAEIFKEIEYNWEKILERIRQQAYLNQGIHVIIHDERKKGEEKAHAFYFEGGIKSYIKHVNRRFQPKHEEIFYINKEENSVMVEAALQYADDLSTRELGFANCIHTPEGGMHITGFRTALTRVLNDYGKKNNYFNKDDDNLTGEDVREGMTAIISVKIRETQFEGQTKAKLGNPEARGAVEKVFGEAFSAWLEEHPQEARIILDKVLLAAKARRAAKAVKETIMRKGALEGMTLPGKLADCQSKNAEDSEIFIVEGDSAGGSAKQARDRRTQAILPLRGKILNVERARLDRMLGSEQIKNLVIALGTAIADEFDIERLRYHKVVIMTDADVDGAHIRTLLLTLFYRYFRPLIDAGFIYIAQPPLYRVQQGREVRYAYSDSEKDRVVKEFQKIKAEKAAKGTKEKEEEPEEVVEAESDGEIPEGETKIKGITIQRYKGLGEMNPEQLWETTMDPAKRIMKQVTIDDGEAADEVFDILMGDEVAPRKHFIQTHAKSVKNLDV